MADDTTVPISEARANLTDLVARVRLLRLVVMLTQRGTPRAAIVPAELGEAIEAAGGADAAIKALRHAAARAGTAGRAPADKRG